MKIEEYLSNTQINGFEKVKVNKNPVQIKFGGVFGENLNISFLLNGELIENIDNQSEKINLLFHSVERADLKELNELFNLIQNPVSKVNYFTKLDKNKYAFNLYIKNV
ncbi:MAG: hypothetical protein U0W24_15565 [Bacteroidales bacterium]